MRRDLSRGRARTRRRGTSQLPVTPYPDVDELLGSLLCQIRQVLGEKLVGLYLHGSLVTGDFREGVSDIDLLAATSADIDDRELLRLQQLHNDLVARNSEWDDRIDVAYLSVVGLKTFRSGASKMALICPGEPFHAREAGKDWLVNWWLVRERGVTLYGPSPATLIDPISREEFVQAVREHAQLWREWVHQMRHRTGQAYTILTMCRALYASENGEQVSKKLAAAWARKQLPEWASLIQAALEWRDAREDEEVDHEATFPETVRFVHAVADRMVVGGKGIAAS